MDPRISLITLGVQDPARSRAFYEAMGWKAAFENDEIVFFQLNGVVLGLFRRESFDADMMRDNDGSGRVALAYNVRERDEVDPLLEQAVQAGGSLLKAAHQAPWGGYSGYFADPDGHAWEIA
ncbi:VOC family protein [Maricaulis parjimensis]|uniref:VOC family protein n=1 Tax=Maricaulis parjimensis TaxID=144023 RepID=UPI001939BACD|nr:VOC family protein [Maricaulis parjimensis]